jgi:hypothetical protein
LDKVEIREVTIGEVDATEEGGEDQEEEQHKTQEISKLSQKR